MFFCFTLMEYLQPLRYRQRFGLRTEISKWLFQLRIFQPPKFRQLSPLVMGPSGKREQMKTAIFFGYKISMQ
ncbi:hypothetical protein L873DRAFT_1811459 [Choiromyces venosus 120613-1]|uniref:Uncharacterized protein n=1 Tax=Choiromyces venosus 120613-1 TaxID=1336337 RepID=A0A3N4JDJ6_9PEZI|nr:hypothetical protein L873DRAFT_1811459 [Choiromyces venosus 120613-1]